MGKIYKLNKGGTVGVSLPKQMKDAGYIDGADVVWELHPDGFLCRLKPLVPVIEAKPEAPLETL